MMTPHVGQEVEREENSHTSLIRVENGTTTLENGLAVSYKVKQIPTIRPSHIHSQAFTQKKGEYMYMNTHGRFICKSLKLETTQTSTNR